MGDTPEAMPLDSSLFNDLIEANGKPVLIFVMFLHTGMPTRADQVRETTRNAISDVYNGDSETYSSLRAAAFVMGQMIYVPEQETSFETLQHMSNIVGDATTYVKDAVSSIVPTSIVPTGAPVPYPNARMEMGF